MERITTPFGFASTTSEVAEGHDLSRKRVVVTGGASGIGIETVRALAALGADVTLGVRNVEAGSSTAADVTASTGNRNLHVLPLDLADRASIHEFVARWTGALDILVNNAGVMAIPTLQRTADGWELQLATNYLGQFELAQGSSVAPGPDGVQRCVPLRDTATLS